MRTLLSALTASALTASTLALGPAPAGAAPAPIPDGFPLLSGYPAASTAEPGPEYGRFGPSRTMRPIVLGACGERVRPPQGADRLRAAWRNPEDGRERQLVLLGSATRAQRYADRVLDLYASCPHEGPRAARAHHRVRPTGLGDAAGAVTTTYSQDGMAMPGLVVTHVVRVGRAVLVSITSGEGSAAGAKAERRHAARQIAGVVAAMADLS